MTLILALATPKFVALLSDRRITTMMRDPADPNKYTAGPNRDSDTKTAILNDAYAMGWAGLGRIGETRWRLEGWLTSILANVEPENRFDVLATEMGKWCQRYNYVGPHTFLAAGYSDIESDAPVPEIVRVANSQRYPHSFDVSRRPLTSGRFLFEHAGARIDPALERELKIRLHSVTGRKELDPDRVFPPLLNILTATANENPMVGKTGMITSFPASAVPLDMGVVMDMEGFPPLWAFKRQECSVTFQDSTRPQDAQRFYPARVGLHFMAAGIQVEMGRTTEIPPLEGLSFPAQAFRRGSADDS